MTDLHPATKAAMQALLSLPAELDWAQAKAIADCMKRQGFRYPPYEVLDPTSAQSSFQMGTFSRRITLLEAQRDGYGYRIRRPNQSDVGKPQEADDAYKATLSPGDRRRYEALLEPPQSPKARLELPEGMIVEASTEGCVATGRALVYGSVESFLRLFYFPQLMPTKSADH